MKTSTLPFCAALLLVGGVSQIAHAQVITDSYVERGLRFPGVRSFEGEPYTQRYSYGTTGSFIFLNGSPRELYYLDYLDRADRARKFGYRMPMDPYFPPALEDGVPIDGPLPEGPVVVNPAPSTRVYIGGGLGWFRRR